MHISVIVPKGEAILSSIVGPFKIFNKVNEYLIETGRVKAPTFQIDLVGISKQSNLYNDLFQVNPTRLIHEIDQTDLVIIPAINGNPINSISYNQDFIPWIQKMHSQGSEIASLCVGAFILAATGLVDNKSCTTHWAAAELFRQTFPNVNLLPEKVITDEDGIYTSGGAYSFLNLLLYLVEKYSGRETAIYCSKLFEIELDRASQSSFAIFSGQKSHDDKTIFEAQQYIESNFNQKISVENLADKFALSRRNFIRRFKKATQNTPIEYIQRVKIEAAKKNLESSTQNINEVMYSIGYSDSKAFRNIFKRYTGISPLEYKNRYNRSLALTS